MIDPRDRSRIPYGDTEIDLIWLFAELKGLNARIQGLQEKCKPTLEEDIAEIADVFSSVLDTLNDHVRVTLTARVNGAEHPEDPEAIIVDLFLEAGEDSEEEDMQYLGQAVLKRDSAGEWIPRGAIEDWASVELQDWAGIGLEHLIPEIVHAVNWIMDP